MKESEKTVATRKNRQKKIVKETMSSISAQGVVERASAELSKRINGLGLRSKHHHNNGTTSGSGKTSVMERVTNVLCGGGSSNHNSVNNTSEKPTRLNSKQQQQQQIGKITGGGSVIGPSVGGTIGSNHSTPTLIRKIPHPPMNHHITSNYHHHHQTPPPKPYVPPPPVTVDQLFQDERFLSRFFLYFTAYERRTLAQVCNRWRDLLYRVPRYWAGLYPILQCRELRQTSNQDRMKVYNSLVRRGFHSLCLFGATDEDALDLVHSFPLASKHVHSLSLRCSSISDRGLEALMDHLQVSNCFLLLKIYFRPPFFTRDLSPLSILQLLVKF